MYKYKLIRSRRKTMSLTLKEDVVLEVRAPLFVSREKIDEFVFSHTAWIEKQLIKRQNRVIHNRKLGTDEIAKLKNEAKEYLPKRVEYYSSLMGVEAANVKITSAKKRFGSCNSKGNICFSYRLMLYPKEAIDYVVVHELAHLKEHNHSKNFYKIVKQYCENYKTLEKQLREN